MGFDVAVLGELEFPSAAKRTAWRRATANRGDHADAAAVMGLDVDDDPRSVARIVRELVAERPALLEIHDEGVHFRIRGVLAKDAWGAHAGQLMAAFLAAERLGGVGVLRCLGFTGIEYGVRVEVAKGGARARKLTKEEVAAAAADLERLRIAIEKRTVAANVARAASAGKGPKIDVAAFASRILDHDNPALEVSRALCLAPAGASTAIVEQLAKAVAQKKKRADYLALVRILAVRGEPASGAEGLFPLYQRPAEFVARKLDDFKEKVAGVFLQMRDPAGLDLLIAELDTWLAAENQDQVRTALKHSLQALLLRDPAAAFDRLAPRLTGKKASARSTETARTVFRSMQILVKDPTTSLGLRHAVIEPLDPRWADVAAQFLGADLEPAAIALAGMKDRRGLDWLLGKVARAEEGSVHSVVAAILAFGDPSAAAALRQRADRAAHPAQATLFKDAAAKLEEAARGAR